MWHRFALVTKLRISPLRSRKRDEEPQCDTPAVTSGPDPGAMREAADRDLTMFGPAVTSGTIRCALTGSLRVP